jgi:hypothetical protein
MLKEGSRETDWPGHVTGKASIAEEKNWGFPARVAAESMRRGWSTGVKQVICGSVGRCLVLAHAALNWNVEVKVSVSKHARRAKVARVITTPSKTRGQSGHKGFCKETKPLHSQWVASAGRAHAPLSGHLTKKNLIPEPGFVKKSC